MKNRHLLLLSVVLLAWCPLGLRADDKPAPSLPAVIQQAPVLPQSPTQPMGRPAPQLTTFDLDFPGGTPRELVAAIQKASGRPLNAVIPDETASYHLPALRMSHVNVDSLFQALQQAVVQKRQWNAYFLSSASFRTAEPRERLTDDTIWTFIVNTQPPTPASTKFYLLTPYLDGGLTVDDITTAVQTAWRMAAGDDIPTLSYHKETHLLIAVGDANRLETIDAVLHALDPRKAAPKAAPVSGSKSASPAPEPNPAR